MTGIIDVDQGQVVTFGLERFQTQSAVSGFLKAEILAAQRHAAKLANAGIIIDDQKPALPGQTVRACFRGTTLPRLGSVRPPGTVAHLGLDER